jgi:C-terminal processing protease CtpA/Prc
MTHFNWRAAALVVLTSSAIAGYALAQQASSSGQDNSASSQGSSSQGASQGTSNSSSQGQNQTSSSSNTNTNNATSSQSSAQGSQDAKSSQGQSSAKNQSNQNGDDRSNANSASERNSSANSARSNRDSARSDRDSARDDRDSARRDRDDRNTTRDRSSRDSDRNADNRSSNSDRDSSREHSSRRGNMRGPDIGLWFNRSSRDGLVISDVSTSGPIAKLGFREGDRIVSVDGHRITREDEFINYLQRSDARRVTVVVFRDGREETIYVEPALLVEDREYTEVDPLERFGIILDDRYDDRIVVWRVVPRSPAYYAGFRAGDVVVTFGGRPYRTRTEFERGSRDWKTGDSNVQIRRGDRTRDLSVEIPNADRSDRRSERMENRSERTAQRDSATRDQGDASRTDRNTNTQRDTNRGGGILNGVGRGRGNR